MPTKKTDFKKPSPKNIKPAPKKKARTVSGNTGSEASKNEKIVEALKRQIAELARLASFPLLNPNPVLEVDSSGKILFINKAAKEFLKKLHLDKRGDLFLPSDMDAIFKGSSNKRGKKFYRDIAIGGRVFEEMIFITPEFRTARIYAHDITDSKSMETEIKRAEISLRKERDFISAILSTAGALVVVLDLKGRIVSFNKTCERITGYSFSEVIGKPFWDFLLIPEEVVPVKSVFDDLKAGQFPNRFENIWVSRDGARHLISWTNTALLDDEENVEFIIATGVDITEQRQTEANLKATYQQVVNEKNRLKAVMEALPVGMALVDEFGGNIQANRAFEEIWGEPRPAARCVEDYRQYRAWWADTRKLLKPEEWASASAIQRGESVIGQILEIERFNGDRIFAYNSATPIRDAKDRITGSAVAIMDITALKRAQDELRDSEEKFRSAFASASIGFAITTPEGRFIDANRTYCTITGYSLDELKTLELPKLIHTEDLAENMRLIYRLLSGENDHFVIENRYIRKDGSVVWGRESVSLVSRADSAPPWIIALIEDISERKRFEESLRNSEEDLNRAQAVSHTGSWRLNIQRNELIWSEENHRIFGIPRGMLMTYETFLTIVHPDDREFVDRKWKAALRGEPYDIEHRIVVGDTIKWVRERVELEFDEDGELLGGFGTTQDITEKKRVEDELREGAERLNMALYAGRVFGFEWDPLTDTVIRSKNCGIILGMSDEEAIRDTGRDYFNRIHPEDREIFIAQIESLAPENNTYSAKYRLVRPDESLVVLEETGIGHFDGRGQLIKLHGMTADVSERTRFEEALLNSKGRLAVLSETAGQLLASDNPQQIVDELCKKVMTFLGCHVFFNYLIDEEKKRLHLNAYDGIPAETAREIEWLDIGAAVCGCVARDSLKIGTENIPEYGDPRTDLVRSFGIKAYACHPLTAQGKVIGTLSFGTRSRVRFTDDELDLMSNIADQVSIAVQRVILHQKLQKYSEELEQEVRERTKEIREKADLIDALFRHTVTPLVLLDKDFNFLRVNQEYARICSKEIDDFYGHNHFDFFPHEENEAIFREVVQSKSSYYAIAKPFVYPDHPEWGVTYWDWTLTPLWDSQGEINYLLFALNDVTERKKAEDQLKESREKLRNLYAHLQLAVEAERTRIAREIHDEFGTILTALNIDLSWMEKRLPGDQTSLIERIHKDVQLINSAIKVVQRVSSELRPGVLDYLGLSAAVEWQVKEFGNRTGIGWDISIDTKTAELDKKVSIAIFRILQETLTNIARHAEASEIIVSLDEDETALTLRVTDNGRGISEQHMSDHHSFGILGMKERVEYLGGDIQIRGEPDVGTTVTVRVPVVNQGDRE